MQVNATKWVFRLIVAGHSGLGTVKGKAAASRNTWTGGHGQQMRVLSNMVNAEVRQARELVASC